MTLEYAFTRTLIVTAGYVGNSTHPLEISKGANNVTSILPTDSTTCGPGAPILFPCLGGGLNYQTTDGNRYYNGLQATL
jgi:hypothetical protein